MGKVRDNFVKVAEHKGVEKAFDHFFYWVRENNAPKIWKHFSSAWIIKNRPEYRF